MGIENIFYRRRVVINVYSAYGTYLLPLLFDGFCLLDAPEFFEQLCSAFVIFWFAKKRHRKGQLGVDGATFFSLLGQVLQSSDQVRCLHVISRG
jgi:hypothetical protein